MCVECEGGGMCVKWEGGRGVWWNDSEELSGSWFIDPLPPTEPTTKKRHILVALKTFHIIDEA